MLGVTARDKINLMSVSKTFTIKVKSSDTRNNGFWLFGRDMNSVNLNTLKSYGTKHIFLNFKAIELYGKSGVESFIQKANGYKSSVWVEKDDRKVNAKSLLGVLSLGIAKDMTIKMIADGSDEIDALDGLQNLILNELE